MYFQIEKIILWPKRPNLEPRIVNFLLGEVNIISGASRTGKSAMIPIIDYCLGSDKCSIPVKTIRDACSWFGIIVNTGKGQKLFARKEPGSQKATGDMYILESEKIIIPYTIESKNSNVDTLKRILDELAGLTNLDFDSEKTDSGFKGRPSFRDLTAFVFQPQNIVANADVLFYKADTYEHREKLRTIFPYVLDAITPKLLARMHELSVLKKELKRKQREYDNIKLTSERWIADIRARISEAKEYGLIRKEVPKDSSKEELVEILTEVLSSTTDEAKTTVDTISESISELSGLRKEESEFSGILFSLRKRYDEMSSLKEASTEYTEALEIQKERLKVSEWLKGNVDENHECPVCGNKFDESIEDIRQLVNSLEEIDNNLKEFRSVPPAFDREYQRVKNDIRFTSEKLYGIKSRILNLERASKEVKEQSYESLKISRFIGNVEEALKYYNSLSSDSELKYEIDDLRDKIKILESEISESEIKAKIKRALSKVSLNAGKILPLLDNERPDDPIVISIDDLTIKVQSNEREDYLWEIGSGSNWLSYHIAIILGFQLFFISLKHSPIPSLIILDQPSQVYFPKKGKESEPDEKVKYKDEDFIAVQKIFSVISSVVRESKGDLQAIILDHAADDVWGQLDVKPIEEWRNGLKLIPEPWLDEEKEK